MRRLNKHVIDVIYENVFNQNPYPDGARTIQVFIHKGKWKISITYSDGTIEVWELRADDYWGLA
jgi:hypothetical protein